MCSVDIWMADGAATSCHTPFHIGFVWLQFQLTVRHKLSPNSNSLKSSFIKLNCDFPPFPHHSFVRIKALPLWQQTHSKWPTYLAKTQKPNGPVHWSSDGPFVWPSSLNEDKLKIKIKKKVKNRQRTNQFQRRTWDCSENKNRPPMKMRRQCFCVVWIRKTTNKKMSPFCDKIKF